MTAHLSPEDRDELQRLRAAISELADHWQREGDGLAPVDDWGDSVEATIRADFLREKAAALRALT